MARVFLENVIKTFDNKITAVNNLNLDIADQEFMVIVGPSGCGKTTILRLIAGLEEPTSGTVTIGDTVANNIPPKDRDVAMVFQNYALYSHMTIFENLAFGLKFRKYSDNEIKNRVEKAAKLLGLEMLLDRKPKALSGGQRQRVAVGRAIVRNPKVFLFDEPLSNLDAKLRIGMRTELKSLQQRLKTTTIHVTHDQIEAMTLGDRVCVLHNGVVQQVAPPLEIYEKPANRFVAGFFGSLPMNFLEGMIRYKNNNPYFVTNGEDILLPPKMKSILTAYKEGKMILGIRPEHLSFNPNEGQNENSIRCKTVMLESLGDRMVVYLKGSFADGIIASVSPNMKMMVDEPVTTYIDTDKIHVFEQGENGRNVVI